MNRRLKILAITFVIGIALLLAIYNSYGQYITNSQKISNNLRIKQIISSDIHSHILEMKAMFGKSLMGSANSKNIENGIDDLLVLSQKIKSWIYILNNGGIYTKSLPISAPDGDTYKEDFVYIASLSMFKGAGMLPLVRLIESKIVELRLIASKIASVNKSNKMAYSDVLEIRKRAMYFLKTVDSIFDKMIKISNNLFYESQIELNRQTKDSMERQRVFNNMMLFMVSIFILWFSRVVYVVINEMKKKLYIDNLTGVSSRYVLEEAVSTERSMIVLLDIDNFSEINGIYGVEFGDKVLQYVANRLKIFDNVASVCRVGGDIFGIYYNQYNGADHDIVNIIKRLFREVEQETISIDKYNLDISITLGAARGARCLQNAFIALDIANEEEREYKIFSNETKFKEKISFNKKWHMEIKRAISEDNIIPFFQPIVNTERKIVKYESLMRLKKYADDGSYEYISPIYLDIAKHTKQYISTSKMLILKTLDKFSDSGEVSINLSYDDIKSSAMRKFLLECIIKYDIGDRLTFEILENKAIRDYNILKIFMDEFRELGVKMAIDDFGKGYSNFKRILDVSPDYIKIDGSLIKNILHDKKSNLLVKNLVKYAQELHIETIAEHIETEEVFLECKRLGVDYFQGYYFSEPREDI